MKTSWHLKSAVSLLLCGIGGLHAEESAETKPLKLRIESQPMVAALNDWASQTGYMVLVPTDSGARGIVAPQVDGMLTPENAVQLLLSDSGLSYEFVNARTVSIRTAAASAAEGATRGSERQAISADEPNREVLEEIVVTGSYIRTTENPVTGARPVQIIKAEQLQRTSAEHVGDFLRKLPVNTGTFRSPASDEYGGGRSTVNLRGIGAQYTLALVDGYRLAGEGEPSDIGAIPPEAIEAVEILPGGASAVYGSDAVAGVLNLKLKKNFEGVELLASYGESSRGDAGTQRVAAVFGVVDERFSFTGSLAYQDREGFNAPDRELSALNRDFRSLGGLDRRSTSIGVPHIIRRSSNPAQRLSIDVSRFAPGHYTGSLSDYVAYNNEAQAYATWEYGIYPPQKQVNGHWSAQYRLFDDQLTFFTRGYANERSQTFDTVYTRPIINVPANNPYNPFGEPVQVTYLIAELPRHQGDYNTTIFQGVAGFEGRLWDRLNYEVAASSYRNKFNAWHRNDISPTRLQAAVARTDALAFNPFGYNANTPEQLALIRPEHEAHYWQTGTNRSFDAKVDGKLFDWYAGQALFAVGFQHRKLDYELRPEHDISTAEYWFNGGAFPPASRRRSVDAFFGELRLPVWSASDPSAFVHSAEITGAVRNESYDDFGDATTGQVAGKIGLWGDSVILRASFAESFLAPTLEALTTPVSTRVNPNVFFDPFFNATVPVTVISGGNPDLEPESGDSLNFGIVFRPPGLPEATFTLDYWKLELSDRIGVPNVNAVLFGTSLSGVLTRDPVTNLPTVDARVANGGDRDVTGVDASAGYRWNTNRLGTFDVNLSATRFTKFEDTSNAGATLDFLGVYNSALGALPKLRANFGVGWTYGTFDTSGSIRYSTPYDDVIPGVLSRRVDSYYTVDLQASYAFSREGFFRGLRLYGGLENALDAEVPFVAASAEGWDRSLADLRGRYYYFGMKQKF